MYRAFRIINNQYGGCVVYIHDVSIHNASELTFAKTGNCPNVGHISHCEYDIKLLVALWDQQVYTWAEATLLVKVQGIWAIVQ